MKTLDSFGSLMDPDQDRDDLSPLEIDDDVWQSSEVVSAHELTAAAPTELSRAFRILLFDDDDENENETPRQRLPPIRLVNMGPQITLTTSCLEPRDQALRNVEPLVRRTSDEIFHEPEGSIWRRADWLLRMTSEYPIPIVWPSTELRGIVELTHVLAEHAKTRSPIAGVSTTNRLHPMYVEMAALGGAAHSLVVGTPWSSADSALSFPPADTPAPPSTAEKVQYVHERVGLTWDQIARMFSVSRRAALYWAAGEKLSSAKEELLGRLYSVVQNLPGQTTAERRAAFMTRRGREDSYWAEFTRRGGPGYLIGGPAVTVAQGLGLGHGDGGDAPTKEPGEQ